MPPLERLRSLGRAVPRWAYIVGGFTVLLALIVTVARNGESVATADPPVTTIAATTTSRPSASSDGSTTSTSSRSGAPERSSTTITTTVEPDGYEPGDLEVDPDDPAVVARPIPNDTSNEPPPTTIAPPPWAASTKTTAGGHLGTDVGCAADLSAASLDRFFADRLGPVLGWDYQHVYPLGGDRYLWLFQDTFIDHSGTVSNLGKARFVHNSAMLQTGSCFTLLHRGSTNKPEPFEPGDGQARVLTKWFWPMGGELVNGQLQVFWAEMVKDAYDPRPPDGLGWHPNRLFLATYDAATMARTSFVPATDSGVNPIYGYAVSSDASFTYLFGNTFEQNMVREGGFWNGPHSATNMYLARVPLGQLAAPPEYRTADGWSPSRNDAVAISSRYYAENPMQPRYLNGQWVAATDVDGYWGDALAVDVAPEPWGPWTTVEYFGLQPRNNDPKMNTYHAHPLPWRDKFGSVVIVVSNNARNMLRDAWPNPHRYRPIVVYSAAQATPAPTTTTSTTSTTSTTTSTPSTTSTTTSTTSTTTTLPPVTSQPTTSSSTTSSTEPVTTTTSTTLAGTGT